MLRVEGVRPLLVSEIFSSIQGEGINLGTPSVFLRLAACNLHCWYCDTKYTWLYDSRLLQIVKSDIVRLGIGEEQFPGDLKVYDRRIEVHELSIDDVKSEIEKSGLDHLVVTGGEPLLQQNVLVLLLQRLRSQNSLGKTPFFVEIETNGSIKPVRELLPLVNQWNVSPKLESSGNSRFSREKGDPLRTFANLSNSFFKFVVAPQTFNQDLAEIESLASRFDLVPGRIILMAEGTDSAILKHRTQALAQICEKKGYRITPRLQIMLWGNKRGT
jgi:7-carboxy-7-deazaguanine synthase